eukprot:3656473-Pyramimonas_sp.AAC.1
MLAVRALFASSPVQVDSLVYAVRNCGVMLANITHGTRNRSSQQRAYIILWHSSSDLVSHILELKVCSSIRHAPLVLSHLSSALAVLNFLRPILLFNLLGCSSF